MSFLLNLLFLTMFIVYCLEEKAATVFIAKVPLSRPLTGV